MEYSKSSPQPMAGENMEPNRRFYYSCSSNQYNFKVHTHIYLNPQINVALSPHQRNFFLEQTEIITESYNWSNTERNWRGIQH